MTQINQANNKIFKQGDVRATKLAGGTEKLLSELIVSIPQVIIDNSKVKVEQFNLSHVWETLHLLKKITALILSTEFNFQGLINKHLN